MEYGSSTLLTDKIGEKLDQKILAKLEDMTAGAFADRLMVDGQVPIETQVDRERDEMLRGFEIVSLVQAAEDSRLVSVLARLQGQNQHLYLTLLRVNDLPWWRWLWLKLRGKPVVGFTA